MPRLSQESFALPSLDDLKEDIWQLANITCDQAGFDQAEVIFDRYRQVFDRVFPDQSSFSDQIASQIRRYKENAKELDSDRFPGLVHFLISTILQEYSSVNRNNLDLFGKEGRSIINQAPMDTKFHGIIKKINEERSRGIVSPIHNDEIKETVGEEVVILSTAARDTSKPAPETDLYHRTVRWHNDTIDFIIRNIGTETSPSAKQTIIKDSLTNKLSELWAVLGMPLSDESKARIATFSEEMSKADILSYKRKGEGEALRNVRESLASLGAALGLVYKDVSFSNFIKYQYEAVTVLAKRNAVVPTVQKERRGPAL